MEAHTTASGGINQRLAVVTLYHTTHATRLKEALLALAQCSRLDVPRHVAMILS